MSEGDAASGGSAVTAAEIIRNFGFWQQKALTQPLTITHHGRARVMLISAETYQRLHQAAPAQADAADFDMLIENLKEGFVMHDAEVRVVKMNRAAEAFFGVKRGDMLGFTVSEATGMPHNLPIQNMLRRVMRSGEIVEYEAESALYPGRRISLRSFPFRDGVATFFLNMTEHERLRQAADEFDAAKRALAAARRVGLAKIDTLGRLVFADSYFESLTQASTAELAVMSLIDKVVEADRARVREAFAKAINDGQTSALTLRMSAPGGPHEVVLALAPLTRELKIEGVMLALGKA